MEMHQAKAFAQQKEHQRKETVYRVGENTVNYITF